MERPTVPLLGAASHPATGWIYFVYLFIDLFGMISTVITGRLQDIICMITGRANVAGRWASFIQIPIMSKESEIVLTPFRNVSNLHFSRSFNLACVGCGEERGGWGYISLYKIYLYRGVLVLVNWMELIQEATRRPTTIEYYWWMTFRYFDFDLFFGEGGEFERDNGRKKKRTNIEYSIQRNVSCNFFILEIYMNFIWISPYFIVDRSNSPRNEMKRFRKLIFNL